MSLCNRVNTDCKSPLLDWITHELTAFTVFIELLTALLFQ